LLHERSRLSVRLTPRVYLARLRAVTKRAPHGIVKRRMSVNRAESAMGATMPICRIIVATVMLLAAAINAPASAQATDVRFVLDFLLQGQQSAFVLGRERGYYAAQKVNLAAFDPGRGGADSITKVTSGTHDIGFGDLSALIEFNARNPGQELLAVLLVYDQA